MDETALVQMPQRRGCADSNPQKQVQFPGFAEQARQHLATMILNQQRRFAVVMKKL
jgi:hypothetical protein